MTDDSPKVVNLRGQPVEITGGTPAAVFQVVDDIVAILRAGTYPAIAITITDGMGNSTLNWQTGNCPVALVGALEALKFEILKQRGQ